MIILNIEISRRKMMGIIDVLLIGFGLSMDAFAVSVCKGLATKKLQLKHFLTVGMWFGGFQALMPLIGYFLGTTFQKYITSVDHWVAFILLSIIGIGMIKEANEKDEDTDASLAPKAMAVLAVATSIDALAVGVTFALMIKNILNLIFAVFAIGITTFILSAVGIWVGNVFGARFKSKAELAGGIILILIGAKILFEGLGVIV